MHLKVCNLLLCNLLFYRCSLSYHCSLSCAGGCQQNPELCYFGTPSTRGILERVHRSIQELRGWHHSHSSVACCVCSCQFWVVFRHSLRARGMVAEMGCADLCMPGEGLPAVGAPCARQRPVARLRRAFLGERAQPAQSWGSFFVCLGCLPALSLSRPVYP